MFKKFLKPVYLFILFFSLFLNTFVQSASAQQSEVLKSNALPISIQIHNTSYSVEKRLVSIDYSVVNKSGSFIDGLRYSFEFYYGDKLEKEGLLFRNLDYIISTTEDFGRLAPNETRRQTIQYTPPRTIPGGNYFIRGTVFNEELTNYGVTYTKEPIRMTGLGGFVSSIVAGVVDPLSGKTYALMEGATLEKENTYLIAIPKSANEELFSFLEKEEVYVDLKITHLNEPDVVVHQKSRTALSSLIRDDDKGIEIKIEPWANMESGSHTAFISFVDSKGEQVSESLLARLLYRGLIGRIYDVDTNINSYRRGEPLDLLTNVVIAGDPSAKLAFLNVSIKSTDGEIQEFKKEIELNGTFQGDDVYLDFVNEKVKRKMIVDEIYISLTDENGKVLDEQIVTMDPNKVFGYPVDSKFIRNIVLSIIILILVIVILAFVKKKINFTLVSIAIAMTLISSSLLFSVGGFALAQGEEGVPGCMDQSAINYNPSATYDPGGYCSYNTQGCTDANAVNYNPSATVGDGSCYYYLCNSGDSTQYSNYQSETTTDPSQYNMGCTPSSDYYCTDSMANNFGGLAPCTYDPINGCTDSTANNYNPNANMDDGSCEYGSGTCSTLSMNKSPDPLNLKEGQTKSIVFNSSSANASNNTWNVNFNSGNPAITLNKNSHTFNSSAENVAVDVSVNCGALDFNGQRYVDASVNFDATCNDTQGGASDNGSVSVRVERDACSLPRLTGELLDIWSVPGGEPAGHQDLCTDTECIDTEFYVKMQCKQCGNGALDLDISYSNNVGKDSVHDRNYTVDTVSDENLFDFSYYTVSEDNLLEKQSENIAMSDKIRQAPIASLAGIPVQANDIINQWIYGPFNFQFCFEFREDGEIVPDPNNDGVYEQMYNVMAETQFGGDYCQLSFETGSTEESLSNSGGFTGVASTTRNMTCDLPGELHGSFFLDGNEDGVRTSDEPYIKSASASADCLGIEASPLGRIFSTEDNSDYTGLSPAQCLEDLKPYFLKEELAPGDYVVSLDPANAFGWIQTTVEGLVNVIAETVTRVDIGIKTSNEVAFACVADPEASDEFPLDVSWNISDYYSDTYDISDLTFVWFRETGTAVNKNISGGLNDGSLYTTYNESTGGPGEYSVSVFARNSSGSIVSNATECSVQAGNWNGEMDAMCAAYPTLNSQTPQLFFGPGENVYWKATVDGGTNPLVYSWTGAAAGNSTVIGPYDVVVGPAGNGQYSFESGPIYTANLSVTDDNSANTTAICSISIKECLTNEDCLNGEICSQDTFTCVIPPPVFLTPLGLDPSIVNEGEQCGLSWIVEDADTCMLYKNGEIINADAGTSTNMDVDPGTYTIRCENILGDAVNAGPVKCLVNPEIREN
jgi:hypothetical protein